MPRFQIEPRSRLFIVFLAGLVALAPVSIDAYLPALPVLAEHFGVDMKAANLTLTAYLIGNAVGQFFGGAMSDHIGRKPVGLAGLSIFLLATLLIVVADSIATVQALRFVQALGGGFASVTCMALLRDVYSAEEVSKKFATVMMVMMLAPLIAPTLGALMVSWGWQAIFIFLSLYALVFLAVYACMVKETLDAPRRRITATSLFAGYQSVVEHRLDGKLLAIRYALFSSFTMGVFMCFLTNAALIYMQKFEQSAIEFAIVFGAHALFLIIGNGTAIRLMDKLNPRHILRTANLLQIVVLALSCGLLFVGFDRFWIVFPLLLLLMSLNGAIGPTASGVFVSYYDAGNSGSAASLITTLRFLIGGVIGGVSALIADDNLLPIFLTMLVSAIVARYILVNIPDMRTLA